MNACTTRKRENAGTTQESTQTLGESTDHAILSFTGTPCAGTLYQHRSFFVAAKRRETQLLKRMNNLCVLLCRRDVGRIINPSVVCGGTHVYRYRISFLALSSRVGEDGIKHHLNRTRLVEKARGTWCRQACHHLHAIFCCTIYVYASSLQLQRFFFKNVLLPLTHTPYTITTRRAVHQHITYNLPRPSAAADHFLHSSRVGSVNSSGCIVCVFLCDWGSSSSRESRG